MSLRKSSRKHWSDSSEEELRKKRVGEKDDGTCGRVEVERDCTATDSCNVPQRSSIQSTKRYSCSFLLAHNLVTNKSYRQRRSRSKYV